MAQAKGALRRWSDKMADWLGMTAELERRAQRRAYARFHADLSGSFGQMEVRGTDASRGGVGAIANEALQEGTLVFVRLSDVGLAAFGSVRRCERRPDGSFKLGIQFRDELAHEERSTGTWDLEKLSSANSTFWEGSISDD